ncbi:MAG TPA: hypothetical protein VMW52_12040 [Phycisphaerae bacterium]|nr:hypothetical protein [Phycisphaerae bacterium]
MAKLLQSVRDYFTAKPSTSKGDRHEALKKQIDSMVAASKRDNEPWEALRQEAIRYIADDQLYETRDKPREGWDRVQLNQIRPAVLQELGLQVQRNPVLLFTPAEDTDNEPVARWEKYQRHVYYKDLKMPMQIIYWLLRTASDGKFVVKYYWDAKADWDEDNKRWIGQPKITTMNPNTFLIDTETKHDLREANWMGTQVMRRVENIIQEWPQYRDKILKEAERKVETRKEDQGTATTPRASAAGSAVALDGAAVAGEPDNTTPEHTEGRLADMLLGDRVLETDPSAKWLTVTEIYFTDRTEIELREDVPVPIETLLGDGRVEQDEEGFNVLVETGERLNKENRPTDRKTHMRPKFPYGRMVLKVGETILNDEPDDQVWDNRRWPYAVGISLPLDGTWRGENIVVMTKHLQDAINTTAIHEMMYVRQFSDPIVIAEEGAIASDRTGHEKQLVARAGAKWTARKGKLNSIRRESPPAMSQGIAQVRASHMETFRDNIGIQETTLGRKAGSGTTAYEISQLQTNSQFRVGLKAWFMDQFIVEIMEAISELCLENLDVGDVVRVLGEKERTGVMELTNDIFEIKYDVNLEVTTALPYDKERKKAEAREILEVVGIGYLPEYLELHDVKDVDDQLAKHEVYQRVLAEMEQEQAQAEAEAEQAQEEEPEPPIPPGYTGPQ